jgi:hypothetical protein
MTEPKPTFADFDLPTARKVAISFRRAYRKHAGTGLPYSEARKAARLAYQNLHPRASHADAQAMADAIMSAVQEEHGDWLWAAGPRLRYDPER